ncbi:hypothetical protein EYZ11_010504 [Aspergillus tanneri]|nr:hypothetical protein EYZ11_010504 [Aspergillus tanneri]
MTAKPSPENSPSQKTNSTPGTQQFGLTCKYIRKNNYICVGISGSPTSRTTSSILTTATTTFLTPTAGTGTAPSPTQSGIAPDGVTYYKVQFGENFWVIVNEKYTYLTLDQ